MGVVEAKDLGVECSGIVTRIGPGVNALAPGDHVIVFSEGTFSSTLMTTERLCAKMAPNLRFAEATTLPCVFATVIHSLMDVARLKKGHVSSLSMDTLMPLIWRSFVDLSSDRSYPFGMWRGWLGRHTDMPHGGSRGICQ